VVGCACTLEGILLVGYGEGGSLDGRLFRWCWLLLKILRGAFRDCELADLAVRLIEEEIL